MMFVRFSTTFVALAVMWAIADAKTDESMVVRVFNHDFKATDTEMLKMLKDADLESHGYKKEVITRLVSESDSDTQVYEKRYFYYRVIECSKLREIGQELDTLLQDILGVEVETKINQEITSKHLDAMKQCKAGLEVHFKEGNGCNDVKTKEKRRRKKRCGAFFCLICWRAKLAA